MGKQSPLEIKGFEKREDLSVRNDYTKNEEYNETHRDAISDGDPQGKGTGHGGHTQVIPNHELALNTPDHIWYSEYNYSQLDTENGGGSYDIEGRNGIGGRNWIKSISKFTEEHQYGLDYVDTTLNIADGQYVAGINSGLNKRI
jgi:hypothetical protein